MNIENIFLESEKLTIVELFLRTSILYFVLFICTKAMKFRQPGIITPYNFLMAAGISHIAAARMVNPKSKPIHAISIILLYTLIYVCISYLYFKLPSVVTQKPIILIKNGKIIKKNLSKAKLTIDNLFSILREKEAHKIENVDYLIAEATGEFSIGINKDNLPPMKLDMGIETSTEILSQILIYKGEIDESILDKNDLDYDWIKEQLNLNNIDDINSVYLGILTGKKSLYIDLGG